MNKISVVPFFGGDSSAAHSKRDNRIYYLTNTLNSLRKYNFSQIFVAVYSEEEKKLIKDYHDNILVINCNPIFLPATTFRFFQKNFEFDAILISEADQEFYINFNLLDNSLNQNNYFSPHRLERINNIQRLNESNITLNNILYNVPNSPDLSSQKTIDEHFYNPVNFYTAFGGSFYCLKEAFSKVKFIDSNEYPIENATGFNIYNTITCLKTKNIIDFYCIHLSGTEYL